MRLDPLRVRITTPPAVEPLTTAEAKLHLRIDHNTEDAYIDALIKMARIYCEAVAQRSFITRTYTARLDNFPDWTFELPYPPLLGVTSIKYTDQDGNESTFSSGNYLVDTHREPGRVMLKNGVSWPAIVLREINGIEIIWTAGYGAAGSNVPDTYRNAMKLLIGHWYENREAVMIERGVNVADLPLGVRHLLTLDAGGFN